MRGDLDGVSIREIFRQNVLIQYSLGHALSKGAGPDHDPRSLVTDGGGKEFGRTGGVFVHEDDNRINRQTVFAVIVAAVFILSIAEIGVGSRPGKAARGVHGGLRDPSGIGAEIYDPYGGLVTIFFDPLPKVPGRILAKGGAADVSDVIVNKLGSGRSDHYQRAGEKDCHILSISMIGHLHRSPFLTADTPNGGIRILANNAVAVHRDDNVSGLHTAFFRRGVLQDSVDMETVFHLAGNHADPHQRGIRHGGVKGGVFLWGKILGIGITQSFQHLFDSGLFQHQLGELIHIDHVQKLCGLLYCESLGRGRHQKREDKNCRQTGNVFFLHR